MRNQAPTQKSRPVSRPLKRPTTLCIDQEVWDRLKDIEAETMAKPSSMANRLLREGLKLQPAKKA